MLVSVCWPGCGHREQAVADGVGAEFAPTAAALPEQTQLGAYFRIEPDGGITILAPKIEMGQGTYTSLPMILADELDADWARVTVMPAPLDEQMYGWQGAGGSTSVWEGWEPLRTAAAAVREMLVNAASAEWKVEVAELRTEAGRVHHDGSRRSAHYGELATAAATLPVPAAPRLKQPAEFRIIGRPQRQVNLEDIVTGRVQYAYDTRVPGMLRASVERAPVPGAKPVRIEDSQARAVHGVRDILVLDKDADRSILAHGVAVIADDTWAALKGRQALSVQWSASADQPPESSERLERVFREQIERPGKVLRNDGDALSALRAASRSLTADYVLPFLAHAPMEPGNCFAHVRPDGVTLRGPLQDPGEAAEIAARLTGLTRDRIQVELPRLGGGFGRRLSSDYAAEAVLLSRAAGAPVHVVWTREDDIRFDLYRPAARHRLAAALDGDGRITAWHHKQVSTSRYASTPWRNIPPERSEFYVDDPPAGMIANYRLEYSPVESPVTRGAWRSVIHSGNAFVVQSFLDELAHAAGADPVEFRLRLLGEERELPYADHGGPTLSTARLRHVLQRASEHAGWGDALPPGRARGVAAHFTFGGYAAQVAEVSVADDGRIRVHHVVAAIDCGIPVNPAGIRAQVEGCIAFGLSAALHGAITFANGGVVQSNFHDYPLLTHDRMPDVEVLIVESTAPPRGTGEISVPPIAPAVANAVFALTGLRPRRTPFTPEYLLRLRAGDTTG
jgi:isoquinoline 1-oxidoreductase beta subunit